MLELELVMELELVLELELELELEMAVERMQSYMCWKAEQQQTKKNNYIK